MNLTAFATKIAAKPALFTASLVMVAIGFGAGAGWSFSRYINRPSAHDEIARIIPSATTPKSAAPSPSPGQSPSPSPSSSPTPAPTTKPRQAAGGTPGGNTTPISNPNQALNLQAGIAAGSSLPSLSASALAQRLDGIRALGAGWIRFDIEWSNIERNGPGQFDWSAYDRVVQAASARGLRIIGILDYTPTWARRSECRGTAMCAPNDPDAFGRFANAAAARYKQSGVHTWEIWNEPNKSQYFQPAADPASYAALLKSAYPAIKQADPSATVITGGLSPADTGGGNYSPPDFATAIYNAGANGFFDALGHHPYTFPVTAAYPNPDNAWGQLTTLHNIMAGRGDGAKKIWITEYGAPTNGPGPTAHTNDYSSGAYQVDETLQALAVTDAFHQRALYSWLGPLLWYSYQDAGTSLSTNENFFGLIRADGSRKPSYNAFIQAVTN